MLLCKGATLLLSEVEKNAAYRLASSIKRQNALKNITIPMYDNLVYTITNALEEKERKNLPTKSDQTNEKQIISEKIIKYRKYIDNTPFCYITYRTNQDYKSNRFYKSGVSI